MDLLTLRRAAHASPIAIGLLILANAVPLLGVVAWGWSLPTILALYWLENGVIGAFALARILTADGTGATPGGATLPPPPPGQLPTTMLAKAVLAPFFVLHYGLFWLVHGVFVLVGLPAMFAGFGSSLGPAQTADLGTVLLAAPVLVLSHGASFVLNWLYGGERLTSTPAAQMAAPYGRVVILHVTIVIGAFAVAALGAPIWALVVMVVVKTAADLSAHLAERRRAAGRAAAGGLTLRGAGGPSISLG